MSRLRAVAALAALAVAGLAACGDDAGKKTSGAPPLADRSATEVLDAAIAALGRVHSFRMEGTVVDKDGRGTLRAEVAIPGRVRVTIEQGRSAARSGSSARCVHPRQPGLLARLGQQREDLRDARGPLGAAPSEVARVQPVPDARGLGDRRALPPRHRTGTLRKAGRATVDGRAAVVIEDLGDRPARARGSSTSPRGPGPAARAVQTGPHRPGGKPDARCHEDDADDDTQRSDSRIVDVDEPVRITAPPARSASPPWWAGRRPDGGAGPR